MIYLSRTFFLHTIIPFDFERDLNKRNKNRFSSRSPRKIDHQSRLGLALPMTRNVEQIVDGKGIERNLPRKNMSHGRYSLASRVVSVHVDRYESNLSLSLSLSCYSATKHASLSSTYIENANYRIGCAELATISISQLWRCATIRKDLFQRSNSRIRRQCVNQIKHNLVLLTLFRNVACTWVI